MNKIEVQGPGFAHTLATGVDAIEFDIGLSADDHLVIVHDRLLSRDIFRNTDGDWIQGPEPTVRSLSMRQLRQYDVGRLRPGSSYAARFPRQTPIDGIRVPTLEEYISLLNEMDCRSVGLNIEVKISPDAATDTATPEQFVDQLLITLDRHDLIEQSVIQSFDWRVPMLVKERHGHLRTSCLTVEGDGEDTICRHAGESAWTGGLAIRDVGGSVPRLVARAEADIWAPWHGDLDAASVAQAHDLGLRVITWTVNETADIERMIGIQVDGIISDYPDHLRQIFEDNGLTVPPRPATASPIPLPEAVAGPANN